VSRIRLPLAAPKLHELLKRERRSTLALCHQGVNGDNILHRVPFCRFVTIPRQNIPNINANSNARNFIQCFIIAEAYIAVNPKDLLLDIREKRRNTTSFIGNGGIVGSISISLSVNASTNLAIKSILSLGGAHVLKSFSAARYRFCN
jgi:hypothetical protein